MFRRRRRRRITYHEKKKILTPELIREIFSYAFYTTAVIVMAWILVQMYGVQTRVIGDSMEPALVSGQKVLVDRIRFRLFSPEHGDLVVFLPNGNTNSHYYIKRIVGVPGETIQIRDGQLYVNGNVVEDDSYDKMEDAGIADAELTLEKDEYFVLGDNRNSSEDSRSANIGPVKLSNMEGRAWYRYGAGGSTGIIMND